MKTQYEICDYDDRFKYRIGQSICDNIIVEYIKIIGQDGKHKSRGYLCKCIFDGYIRPTPQYNLNNGKHSCVVCDRKLIIKGINDVATTNSELVKYIHDKSLAHKLSQASTKTIDVECPVCHHVKKGNLHAICRDGFSCPKCGDGRTIPNKIMYLILEKANMDFQCEVFFDWCKFELPNRKGKLTHGIYDFVIESKKVIIEMDGGLGHGKKMHSRSTKTLDETIYRDKMKDELAYEHGYQIIRIDCNYTEDNKLEFMLKSLRESKVSSYVNLDNIDLKALFYEANNSSLVKKAADLWNQGLSRGEISEILKFGKATIRKYLKIATNLGFCSYDADDAYKRGIDTYSIGDYEYSIHFRSASDLCDFIDMYNIPLNFNSIQNRFNKGVDSTVINGLIIKRQRHNTDK